MGSCPTPAPGTRHRSWASGACACAWTRGSWASRPSSSRRSSADATRHARFKYFPEAGDDLYQSFLGVPMVDRGLSDEVRMVSAAAGQFAPIVGDARMTHEALLQAERLRVVQVTMRPCRTS